MVAPLRGAFDRVDDDATLAAEATR